MRSISTPKPSPKYGQDPMKDGAKKSTEGRIIEAAVKLFSRHGFTRTSTGEIARLSGFNQITLFRHFPRKEDLFWAATKSCFRHLRISSELRVRLENDEDPRIVLPQIVTFFFGIIYYRPEMLRLLYLILFETEHAEVAEVVVRKHLSPIFRPICEYLARCAEKGLIRKVEPSAVALTLAASVVAQHGLHHIINNRLGLYIGVDSAIAIYTTFWLQTLIPERASSALAR
jgi:AcrR family transcriptional regulator